jgi:hypothetical protein
MNPLSGIFSEAWAMYRAHAAHLIGIAFVIYLAAAIVTGVLSLIGGFAALLLGIVISLVAGFIVQAALVKSVQDLRDGRADLSIGQTLAAGTEVLAPVAAAGILAGIAIGIGLLIILVPGLFLLTIWAVLIPVVVLERTGALNAFGRSYQLVRHHGLQVFGILVVTWIILFVVKLVLGAVLSALPLALASGLSTVVAGSLVAPFTALIVTLMYYRLVAAPAPGGPGGYPQQPGYPQQGYPQQPGYPQQGGDPQGGGYPPPPPGYPQGGGYPGSEPPPPPPGG